MTVDLKYGICYNPTWYGWAPPYSNTGPDAQFSDSDFFNDSFTALWADGRDSSGNNFRGDLSVIANQGGFNLIHLYNWGPTRGWNAAAQAGLAHLRFLNVALSKGMQVIIPVSNYFLSDDTYAWDHVNPDPQYSFDSAPQTIKFSLMQFIRSVTDPSTGKIHPAVHSFSVGNEIDLDNFNSQGSSGAVDPAHRLARTIWWLVNLREQITSQNIGHVLLTSPISNIDQNGSAATPFSYWFGAFINGVVANVTPLPYGTSQGSGGGATTFASSWNGLNSFSWYADWYYNSVNIYQSGRQLYNTLSQYDKWKPNRANNLNWPGQQFVVPLILTEVGSARQGNGPDPENDQFNAVVEMIAKVILSYFHENTSSLLRGCCFYEFNDEPFLPSGQQTYGIMVLRNYIMYSEQTGTAEVSYGTWPSTSYPVYQLKPVTNRAGETLIAALKAVFQARGALASFSLDTPALKISNPG